MSKRKKPNFLVWLPALMVTAASIVTAAGISLVPGAGAASGTGSVTITGTVNGSVAFSNVCNDTTDPFNGTALPFLAFTQGGAAQVLGAGAGASGCEVVFAANDDAEVLVQDSNPAPFFCTNTCAAGTADAFENENGNGVLNAGEFAIGLESTSGTSNCNSGCLAGAGAGFAPLVDSPATPANLADDTGWKPLTAANTKVCGASASTASGSVTCDLAFAAQPKAIQNQGAYTGTANFTVNTI